MGTGGRGGPDGYDFGPMGKPRLEITTPVFEGPLELLLALVERDQVDLFSVRLHELTAAYLAAVAGLKRPDANEMSEFLWLAARLLLLKSMRLLPVPPTEPEEIDLVGWEEDVRARLVEYQAYRRLAQGLMERASQQEFSFPAPVREIAAAGQEEPLQVEALVGALEALLARIPPRPLVVTQERWTLEDRLEDLNRRLAEGGFDLVQVLLQSQDRLQAVVTFVALLELLRQGRVSIRQEHNFASIWVEPR